MARQRRRTGCASFVFLAVLAAAAGIGFALWHGTGPLPDPEDCVAEVNNHQVVLAPDQAENAALIAAIGVQRGLPARAVSIALATAYQESKIRNLSHGDRDSIGIFQQRPSQGWGTVAQIRNEVYSINKFYDALEKVAGYETMRITEAAQKVQRSGFPEAYQGHAADARVLASALTGYSPDGAFTCVVHDRDGHGSAAAVQASLTRGYGDLGATRTTRQNLTVPIQPGTPGNRLGWSVAAYLVAHAGDLRVAEVRFDNRIWRSGRDSESGWVRGKASGQEVAVVVR
jgi:hypothetical protein